MLKEFYLGFNFDKESSSRIKHVQYNFWKRLSKIAYVSYRRIDFSFELIDESKIGWDDKKTAKLFYPIDRTVLENVNRPETIQKIYEKVIDGLKLFWKENKWDVSDLNSMLSSMQEENFDSTCIYGKTFVSKDKKYKAELFCHLYSEFTEYYLQFLDKKNSVTRRIKFLSSNPDPSIIFGYFSNLGWRDNDHFILSDMNKEIYFIFEINSDDFSTEIFPKFNSLEKCQSILSAFQKNTPNSELIKVLM